MADVKPFGTVYYLADPRVPDEPRYIGQTVKRLSLRLAQHVWQAKRARDGRDVYRSKWIRSLLEEGLRPILCAIAAGSSQEHLDELERSEIAAGRKAGLRLCNHADGGSVARGWKHSPERIEQMRRSSLFVTNNPSKRPEVREQRSAAMRGKSPSIETREKLAAANRGKKASPETLAKRRLSAGAAWTEAARKRQSDRLKEVFSRPEVIARRKNASQVSLARPEVRAKLSASTKRAWATGKRVFAESRSRRDIRDSRQLTMSWSGG